MRERERERERERRETMTRVVYRHPDRGHEL